MPDLVLTLCSPCAPANTFLSVSVLALSLLELTYYPNRVFELVFELVLDLVHSENGHLLYLVTYFLPQSCF